MCYWFKEKKTKKEAAAANTKKKKEAKFAGHHQIPILFASTFIIVMIFISSSHHQSLKSQVLLQNKKKKTSKISYYRHNYQQTLVTPALLRPSAEVLPHLPVAARRITVRLGGAAACMRKTTCELCKGGTIWLTMHRPPRGSGRCKILGMLMNFPCGSFLLIQVEILGVINAYILPYCKKYWGCCGSPSSAAPGAASHLSLYSILAIALSSEVMIYSLCTTFASGRIEMTRARSNRDVFFMPL